MAAERTGAAPGRPTGHPDEELGATGTDTMGDLVGTRATLAIAATPTDSRVGQSRRTPELVDRDLAVRARGDAALHTLERVLVEHGRISPAHPLWKGADRPASAERSRVDHLVGRNSGRLERSSNSIRMGWQTEGTPPASKTTPPWWFRRHR